MSGSRAQPEEIGRYRIDRTLGTGAMGVVYLAHDPMIERPVALKLIRANLLSEADRTEYVERFMREARAIGRFHHPNIVSIYDRAVHEGNPFLVMEYVQGETLFQIIHRSGRFAPPFAVAIMQKVLLALGAAHDAGIVHRDVKPANVMLTMDHQVKMMDFGIARADMSELTQPGAMIGTPRYMCPEYIRGDAGDARGDLFSAAVVLHEMLIGTPAFDGGSMVETMHKVLNIDPPDLSAVDVTIPPAVAAVVIKALSKKPDQRYQTAKAMADALGEALDRGVTPDDTGTIIQYRKPPAFVVPDDLARLAERALAESLGPMAKIMVKRAIPAAKSAEMFWDSLAEHIQSGPERQAFLRKRPD